MILKKNSKSNSTRAVKALQYLLGVSVDGKFGTKTYNAVKAFQKEQGLKTDGIAGSDTMTALAKTLPDVKYKDYSKSKYVKAVQALVGSSIDGKYGSNTKANVIAFQSSARLTASGDVTQNDWLALWECAYEKTAPASGVGGTEPVDYKQGDSRWGKIMYSNHNSKSQTIASSGCGPTSMADIMAAWIDSTITPVEMCEYALNHGFRTRNSGTAWGFYESIFKTYAPFGFSKFVQTKSMATLKAALADGAFAVCSMGPDYWTQGGHFICAYKVEGGYVYAKDPASKTRKRQKTGAFEGDRKQFFIFWPIK